MVLRPIPIHACLGQADTASGRRYVYGGAAVNASMYAHSFTLVQELGRAASLLLPGTTRPVQIPQSGGEEELEGGARTAAKGRSRFTAP